MPRSRRPDMPGATHHIIARGNRQQEIFLDASDYRAFVKLLGEIATELEWSVFSYCLMPNHYHLLLRTKHANLASGMRRLNSRYSQRANWRHENVGHMFQGRYKSFLVEEERYLLTLLRYIALNPVKAGLAARPQDWQWSNHATYLPSAGGVPPWTDRATVLEHFKRLDANGHVAEDGRQQFCAFVDEGIDNIWGLEKELAEIPPGLMLLRQEPDMDPEVLASMVQVRPTKRAPEHDLEHYQRTWEGRGEAMAAAHLDGGHRQVDIAAHFGVHPSTVAHAVRNYRARVTSETRNEA